VERIGRESMVSIEAKDPRLLPGLNLSESDVAELERRWARNSPGRLERARAMWFEGADGWIDDILAAVRPWGVDLAQLQVPVTVWYGVDDSLVPRTHTEWLIAHLPGVEARPMASGHVSPDDSLVELFSWGGG